MNSDVRPYKGIDANSKEELDALFLRISIKELAYSITAVLIRKYIQNELNAHDIKDAIAEIEDYFMKNIDSADLENYGEGENAEELASFVDNIIASWRSLGQETGLGVVQNNAHKLLKGCTAFIEDSKKTITDSLELEGLDEDTQKTLNQLTNLCDRLGSELDALEYVTLSETEPA